MAIPTPLQSYTAGAASVTVALAADPPRLADVFAALDAAYPGVRFRMVDEAGRVRPHVQVFVGGAIERDPAALLPPDAEVMIVGALSGG
ncbi:MAG: MoaD/ThiS family protein [Burkholderiales bacterium]